MEIRWFESRLMAYFDAFFRQGKREQVRKQNRMKLGELRER